MGGSTGAAGSSGANEGSGGGAAGVEASDGVDGAPKCDETQSPTAEPCLLSDDYAVFVSRGAIHGVGTRERPMGTIADGMMAAKARGMNRVIVCNAVYWENVEIQSTNGELSIYGGFACPIESDAGTDWTPTPGTHAVVAPPNNVPLKVTSTAAKVVISGIDFVAANVFQGESSIGAIVAGSPDVTLVDVSLTAGKGGDGADGANGIPGAPGLDPTKTLPDGVTLTPAGAAVCSSAAPAVPPTGAYWNMASSCGSRGGGGGDPIYNGQGESGVSGTPQIDVSPPNVKNGGVAAAQAGQGIVGGDGIQGSQGNAGTNGVSAPPSGAFDASGYSPASGSSGTDGHAGQGGGGGGASVGANNCTGAGGGVGGMGGCGGGHGEGGKGGGASVALISWDSGVVLDGVQLTAADGGAGGNGGDTGVGGHGGFGTNGGSGANGIASGGVGAVGGAGGYGGAGAGGTGGPSYGLVYHGTKPTELHPLAPKFGSGGQRGKGGNGTAAGSSPGPNGTYGDAADRHAVTS